jgi:hypothetical protein
MKSEKSNNSFLDSGPVQSEIPLGFRILDLADTISPKTPHSLRAPTDHASVTGESSEFPE